MKESASLIIDTIYSELISSCTSKEFEQLITISIKDFVKNNSLIDSFELINYISNIIYEYNLCDLGANEYHKLINLAHIHFDVLKIIELDDFQKIKGYLFAK
jgi:hypothetical protein